MNDSMTKRNKKKPKYLFKKKNENLHIKKEMWKVRKFQFKSIPANIQLKI